MSLRCKSSCWEASLGISEYNIWRVIASYIHELFSDHGDIGESLDGILGDAQQEDLIIEACRGAFGRTIV